MNKSQVEVLLLDGFDPVDVIGDLVIENVELDIDKCLGEVIHSFLS